MAKLSRKFVQLGCLSQEKTRYENLRQKKIERNAAFLSSLGIKSLANELFGSNLSAKKKSSKLEKSKMGSENDDEYQPVEGEQGMSSFSEGVVSSRLQGNKVCRAPRKKKGDHATHISRDSQPCYTNTSIQAGETQGVPRQALTPLVDHVEAPTTVVVNVTYPLSEEQISIDVLGKRSVYVKEYDSHRSTISLSKQPQAPNPQVADLQQKIDDQAKTLTKYSWTLTIVQGLLQVLAAKAGIDPAEVQELIDRNNTVEGTSGEENDVANTSREEDAAAGTSEG